MITSIVKTINEHRRWVFTGKFSDFKNGKRFPIVVRFLCTRYGETISHRDFNDSIELTDIEFTIYEQVNYILRYYNPCSACLYFLDESEYLPIQCAVNPLELGFGPGCPDFTLRSDSQ